MNKYEVILLTDQYKKAGYSDKEINIIGELDFYENSYRENLEKCFNTIPFDFQSFFEKIQQIENDTELHDEIKRYANYLFGVCLPFYDPTIQPEDIKNLKNIDETLDNIFTELESPTTKSWVKLEKQNIKDNSEYTRLDDIILENVNDKIKNYIINHHSKWSIITGIYHHFIIKNHKSKVVLKI